MKQSLLLLEAHQATVQIENIIHAMQVDLWYGGKPCKNEAECITPIWVSELSLNLDDKNAIHLGDWLTDKHISAANQLLKRGFPQCKGLDNPIGENFSFPILRGVGVQILQVDESHWICVSTIGCTFGELNVYDSRLTTVSPESTSMSVFPASAAAEDKSHAQCTTFHDKILNIPVYCICHLPWHKEDMIQCGTCMDWYHPSCLSLPYHIFKSSEPWRCSLCSVSRI